MILSNMAEELDVQIETLFIIYCEKKMQAWFSLNKMHYWKYKVIKPTQKLCIFSVEIANLKFIKRIII